MQQHNEIELTNHKNPLTSYDIFGYIAPGMTLIISLVFFEVYAKHFLNNSENIIHPFFNLFEYVESNLSHGNPNWFASIAITIIILIVCFIIGHIVASISTLFVEGLLIAKGHGYPYQIVLDRNYNQYTIKKMYYRGIFAWFNIFALLVLTEIFYSLKQTNHALALTNNKYWPLYVIGFMTILKLIFSESNIDAFKKRPQSHDNWFYTKGKSLIFYSFRIFAGIYDLIFNQITHSLRIKSFSQWFIDKYDNAFFSHFQIYRKDAGAGNHWLPYLYVREHSVGIIHSIDNWKRLYLFTRNLSTSFYISFVYSITWLCYHQENLCNNLSTVHYLFLYPFIFLILSFFLHIRYYYLFVAYFSKIIYRSFVYSNR